MKRFNLNYILVVFFGVIFMLIYFGEFGLDISYAQDLNCDQQQTEDLNNSLQVQTDLNQQKTMSDEDLERKWREAVLASILDDLFWLLVIASVGAMLDVITGTPW